MNKYECNICGTNNNPICTAIGTDPPHDCPYNLGDFEWKTANKVNRPDAENVPEYMVNVVCKECGKKSKIGVS